MAEDAFSITCHLSFLDPLLQCAGGRTAPPFWPRIAV